MKPCLLVLFLLLSAGAVAQDLALATPLRTIDLTFDSARPLPGVRLDAFTGDYPYRVRGGPTQLAFYTGIPLYAPVILSFGSVNQIGYRDDYSVSTPLALLTAGYQADFGFLEGGAGPFVLWGARWNAFSGGASYRFGDNQVDVMAGWFSERGAILARGGWQPSGTVEARLQARLALPGAWGVLAGVGTDQAGAVRWELGVGTYLYEPPANALVLQSWDHVVAHRGSLLRAPENTKPAVELALREGQVEGVELDVQRTADDTFVFVHDDFLFRYTGTLERVVALSGKDLRQRDFGRWFNRAFAGTTPMILEDLGPIAVGAPTNRWVFDLKNIGTSDVDAAFFLAAIDRVLPPESPRIVSTGDVRLLAALRPLNRYPLGLQIDVARNFFLWGDFFPPALGVELEALVRDTGVTSFFLFSSKYANHEAIEDVAHRLGLTYYVWNFHDRIYGRDR